LLFVDESNQIVDFRIFKTKSTYKKLEKQAKKYNRDILLHPNPAKLTREFWERYRKTKNGIERLKLIKELKILEDTNIFRVYEIWIDIDSDFNQAFEVLNEMVKFFNKNKYGIDIVPSITLIKTKSGHLRFSFSIISLYTHGKNKNGKTNLENIKEFVKIINAFFTKHGLKADATFTRINHPIWLTKKQTVILEATHEVDFYLLFQKAKELKKEYKLYESKPQKKKQKQLRHIPAFLANKLSKINEDYIFQKAVESLYNKNKDKGRYIYFLQVLAGWCKYLNKSYSEYYDIAYKYCNDKQRDIETAWKYAKELEFKAESKYHSFEEYADKVISYLKEHKKATRQELLKEIFFNQKWLEQEVMQSLKENGLIEETFEKKEKGRPAKLYKLKTEREEQTETENQENTIISEDMPANPCVKHFSLYNNKLSKDNLQYGGGWKEYQESVIFTDISFISSIVSHQVEKEKDKDIQLNKSINISVSPEGRAVASSCEQPQKQEQQLTEEELKAFEEKKRKLLEKLNSSINENKTKEEIEKQREERLREEVKSILYKDFDKILEAQEKKRQKLDEMLNRKPKGELKPAIFISNTELKEQPDNNQANDLVATEKEKQVATGQGYGPQQKPEQVKQQIDYELIATKDDYLPKPNRVAVKKLELYRRKYKAILNYSWKRLKKDEILYFLINCERLIAERGLKDILKILKRADLDEKINNPTGWLISLFSISLKNSRFLYLIT